MTEAVQFPIQQMPFYASKTVGATAPMHAETGSVAASHARAPFAHTSARLQHHPHALLIVDRQRRVFNFSPAAARLLGLVSHASKGVPLDQLGDGHLAAIPLRPNASMSTTIFSLANGRKLMAKTCPVQGNDGQFVGWIVELQEAPDTRLQTSTPPPQHTAVLNETLHEQIQALQDLIKMLPTFGEHPYWQNLLVEHMTRLTGEMTMQLQVLASPSN